MALRKNSKQKSTICRLYVGPQLKRPLADQNRNSVLQVTKLEYGFKMSELNRRVQILTKFAISQRSIVGSVVECSPATRAARVRFPDDANIFFLLFSFFTVIFSIKDCPITNIFLAKVIEC